MKRSDLPPVPVRLTSASRREFLRAAAAAGIWVGLSRFAPAYAQSPHAGHSAAASPPVSTPNGATNATVVDLAIDKMDFRIGERIGQAVTVNGSLPAPVLRFRQGQEVEPGSLKPMWPVRPIPRICKSRPPASRILSS
jgi:hypothetical protein